jgi:hypothetical protein
MILLLNRVQQVLEGANGLEPAWFQGIRVFSVFGQIAGGMSHTARLGRRGARFPSPLP